jgi:hypothetical protein
MNYQEFLKNIQTQLSVRLPDADLHIQQIARNNGSFYDGLVIVRGGINIAPTIYLMPYYHRYLEGVSLEDIYADILDTYQKNLPDQNFDTTIFTNFEKAKKRIVMRVVNYERNLELLAQVPHFRYLDLAVVFYCLLSSDETQQASILIYNQHLSFWGIDADTLYECALENTPNLLPHEMKDMTSILKDVLGEDTADETEDIPMYVLTNRYHTNGACVILYDQLLKQLADSFDRDLVVLPSSIHEVLLVPVEVSVDLAQYDSMVQEVNETQLADDEVLSNHAYFFSRANGLLSLNTDAVAS